MMYHLKISGVKIWREKPIYLSLVGIFLPIYCDAIEKMVVGFYRNLFFCIHNITHICIIKIKKGQLLT